MWDPISHMCFFVQLSHLFLCPAVTCDSLSSCHMCFFVQPYANTPSTVRQ